MIKLYYIIVIVLVFIIDIVIYFFYGGNKKVLFLYRSLIGGNIFCKVECDNDLDCNGYFINGIGCFISRCDIYLNICMGVSCVNL